MKKLLALCLLLAAGIANAQKITEKDLLGSWHLSKFEQNGVLANFETGEATAIDPELNGSPDIEYFKEMLKGPIAEQLKTNKMIFKPGKVVQMTEMNKSAEYTYTITAGGATDQMLINTTEKMTFEAVLEGGMLRLSITQGRYPATMYFAKDK